MTGTPLSTPPPPSLLRQPAYPCSHVCLCPCLAGQYKFMTQDGQVIDSTILDTGEIELVDVKVLEGHPLVVVRFSVQQINCARDKFGNVTEGAPDDVQRVYYLWALQQEEAGLVDEAGKYWPPRWQLREMLVQGMHNLI